MRIAIVITVKNEARLLRQNLLYHLAIGVTHAFVYFDDTSDNGKDTISELNFVTISDSVKSERYMDRPYLNKFTSKAKNHHTARQCLNTYDAFQQCKSLDIDWLISLDADELVCTSNEKPSHLVSFLHRVPENIDIVYMNTLEALSRKSAYMMVFAEETLFKTQPTFGGRFKNIVKRVYNPFTKSNVKYSYWFGQHMGKAALRIASEIVPVNVHRYRMRDGSEPEHIRDGYILHYHAYDIQDFIKKFTNFANRPNTFLSGNKVNSLKLLLRDVVNTSGMSQQALGVYFEKNLMFNKNEVCRLQKNRYLWFFKRTLHPLREITSVKKVFESKINTP